MAISVLKNRFFGYLKRKGVYFIVLYIAFLLISSWNDIHFFKISYIPSGSFYDVSGTPYAILFYLTLKIAYALILFFLMSEFQKIVRGIRNGDKDCKRRFLITSFIFIIYLFVLILCWPGIWWCNGADEFKLVDFTRHLQVQYHQGFMMSFVYFMAYMIFPNPVFVIILQTFVGSIVFGNILSDFCREKKYFSTIILFLVIFSPCSLYFAMYPMRAYLTAVFFVAFIFEIWKLRKKDEILTIEWIRLILIGIIVINFRIEMMIIFVFFPFLMWGRAIKKQEKRWILKGMFAMLISVAIISGWKRLGNQANSLTHNMLSFTAPLAEIITQYFDEYDMDDLVLLNKYFDVNRMINEHSDPKNVLKYNDYERYTYPGYQVDTREYRKVKVIIAKILLSHPGEYLKNKGLLAARTFGIVEYGANKYRFPDKIKPESIAYLFKQINPELSNWIKDKIAGDFNLWGVFMFKILYAMWLPELLLCISVVYDLIRKNVKYLFLKLLILCIFVAVFLTAMHPYTMYYYAPFLGACIMLVLSVEKRDKM